MKYIAFDTETTGIEPGSRIVELAGILFDESGVLDIFETLINPGMPIPADATALHGITDEIVQRSGEETYLALAEFCRWCEPDAILVAHYASFDTGMMSWAFQFCGVPQPIGQQVIDTWQIAKHIGATKNNKLITLVEHYGINRAGLAHRAMNDADACMRYFNLLLKDKRFVRFIPHEHVQPWADAGHEYSYVAPEVLPESIASLPALVADGGDFTFAYHDGKGEHTERTITPYGWALKGDVVMFHGWCHLRNSRRTFRADRVT